MSDSDWEESLVEEPVDDTDDDEDFIPDEEYDPPPNNEDAADQMAGDFECAFRHHELVLPQLLSCLRVISRIIGRAQLSATHDNADWEFDIGEDAEFDMEEEMRMSSGVGRRRGVRNFLTLLPVIHIC